MTQGSAVRCAIVYDYMDTRKATSPAQLDALIARRSEGNRSAHFIVAACDAEYPCLIVYVRDEVAILYYMPTETQMWMSKGELNESAEPVEFHDEAGGGRVWLQASGVLPWCVARSCILDFARDWARPARIPWTTVDE